MSEMSPKELDQLFQQGSEQHDFEYNADAWDEMEILLDEDDRRRGFLWWWLGGAVIVLLLAWVYTFGMNTKQGLVSDTVIEQKNEIKVALNEEECPQTEELNVIQSKTIGLKGEKKGNIQEVKTEQKQLSTTSAKQNSNKKIVKTTTTPPVTNTSINIPKKDDKQTVVDTKFTLNDIDNKNLPIVKRDSFINGSEIIASASTLQTTSINEEKHISKNRAILLLPLLPIQLKFEKTGILFKKPNFAEFLARIEQSKTADKAARKAKREKLKNKGVWYKGYLAGAEMATSGTSPKFNWKVGLHIEYRYQQKFRTGIGINYSQKKYDIKEGGYTPPQGFWTRMIAPQNTSATTSILEIPLSMGYFLNGYKKSGFFANAGLTSYLMLRENYTYAYDLPDPDLIREWGTKNTHAHWMGMAEFSIGYQRVLNKRKDFLIAPYIQVPLAGIGHGQVKLWSAGLHLKLLFKLEKWHFKRKSSEN